MFRPRLLWLALLIGAAYLVWRWRQQQAAELALPPSYAATNTVRPSLGVAQPPQPATAAQPHAPAARRIPTRVHRGAPPSRPAVSDGTAAAPAAPAPEPPAPEPAEDRASDASLFEPADAPAAHDAGEPRAALAPEALLGAAEDLSASIPIADPALAAAADLPDTMPPAPDGVPETVAPPDAEGAATFTPGLAPAPRGGEPEVISAGSPDTISEEREPTPPVAAVAASGVGLVNINTADEDVLVALPGIGRALARRIIAHREEHGPFPTIDALVDIQGIGTRNIEEFRAFVTV